MYSTLLFAAVLLVSMAAFAWSCKIRYSILFEAQPRDRFDRIGDRIGHVLTYMFAQKKLFKEFGPGLMHALIFWGFLVLQVRSINHLMSPFFGGHFSIFGFLPALDHAYLLVKDITELVVLLLVGVAAYRRLVIKPKRIHLSGDALLVLVFIGGLMLTDFLYEAAKFAYNPADPTKAYQPISALFTVFFGGTFGAGNPATQLWSTMFFWAHCLVLLGFLNYLPWSKHMHVLTVLPNIFFDNLKRDEGNPLRKMDDLEAEFEKDDPRIGVSKLHDMPWTQILNIYSCTENGRCSTNCPAEMSGKPLNPRKVMEDLKHLIHDATEPFSAHDPETMQTVIDAVGEDVIWSCTTCGSCEENCPIMNGFVQNFVDMRRYLVMMEAKFPKELNLTFRNLENKNNPWGLPVANREDWCEDLEVPKFAEQETPPEFLFWVGCAGAFDDRSKKTARALVDIFNGVGLSYGILGKDEGCSGDTARRLGNEYLFEMMAGANIELFNELKVKKIIVMCPHCLQTLGNEYKDFGGDYQVIHHSELLNDLQRSGKLKLKGGAADTVVYHDSCYLGRYNKIYEAPRDVLSAVGGVSLKEADRNRETGFCCGAGGGWAWMEEHEPRMNNIRTEQLLETGAKTIATACPFCKMMIADGVANKGKEEEVRVRDIAEVVRENMS